MSFLSSPDYRHGLELFNRQEFFDAHEVLEDVWREAPGPEKKFLQGLIQVAVGLHHFSTGNRVGAQSLLARAHRNLSAYPDEYGGLKLADVRRAVERCAAAVERGEPQLPIPRLDIVADSKG